MSIRVNNMIFHWSFRKFFINILVLSIILAVGLTVVVRVVGAALEPEVALIAVQPGDTLWTIAENIAPRIDPRITIEKIKVLNKLEKSNLTRGQILKIYTEN